MYSPGLFFPSLLQGNIILISLFFPRWYLVCTSSFHSYVLAIFHAKNTVGVEAKYARKIESFQFSWICSFISCLVARGIYEIVRLVFMPNRSLVIIRLENFEGYLNQGQLTSDSWEELKSIRSNQFQFQLFSSPYFPGGKCKLHVDNASHFGAQRNDSYHHQLRFSSICNCPGFWSFDLLALCGNRVQRSSRHHTNIMCMACRRTITF